MSTPRRPQLAVIIPEWKLRVQMFDFWVREFWLSLTAHAVYQNIGDLIVHVVLEEELFGQQLTGLRVITGSVPC